MVGYQGVSTLEVLEEAKNYNSWIAQNFLPHLTSPVLEIGAGIGNISNYFSHIDELILSDNDTTLLASLKKSFHNKKNVKITHLDLTKRISKKYQGYFSTIVGINVLEHIEEDRKTLILLRRALKPNGTLLLLVPAKHIAYTKLDKELGHVRRYEKEELIEKLQNSGYKIESVYFFNLVGLMSWMIRDKIGRSPHLKPYHIKTFDMIVPFLKPVEKRWKPFVGISLVAVATRL